MDHTSNGLGGRMTPMYRVRPGRFYCLTDSGTIVVFRSPAQRQHYINEIVRVGTFRCPERARSLSPELAAMRGAVQVPEAERSAAYARIVRETHRMADLLTRSDRRIARRLA